MCRLIETIRIENGVLQNINYHNDRFYLSRSSLFGIRKQHPLEKIIHIPDIYRNGIVRCRVTYSIEIHSVEFFNYIPKVIQRVKLVQDDEIEYRFKFENRTQLNELLNNSESDEILIIKNGYLTDSSISNIALRSGKDWYTPDTPLHKGTIRQFLLDTGRITERAIKPENLDEYDEIRLINALLPLSTSVSIPLEKIVR